MMMMMMLKRNDKQLSADR